MSLIGKLFIKDADNVENPVVRRKWGTLVSLFCIVMNVLLFVGKFLVGVLTGSVSVQADAINNLSDAGASLVTLISFKISAKPADRDHPFGHARMEYIASLVVSFLILFIGVELVKDAVGKLLSPSVPEFKLFAVIVLSISVAAKLLMALVNRRVGKKISSDVMRATASDSLSDACATAAVLIATIAAPFLPESVAPYIDPALGILVAVLIFVAGLRILNDTKNSILGTAPNPETVAAMKALIAEYPEALGVHDMVVHNYGPGKTLASLHIEVDGKKDIFRAHDIIDLIERRLYEELHIICTIHMDPIVRDDEEVAKWRAITLATVKEIDESLEIHDFRMVPGFTHTNLIFDIALPFEVKITEDDLKEAVGARISAIDDSFFTVITVDRV